MTFPNKQQNNPNFSPDFFTCGLYPQYPAFTIPRFPHTSSIFPHTSSIFHHTSFCPVFFTCGLYPHKSPASLSPASLIHLPSKSLPLRFFPRFQKTKSPSFRIPHQRLQSPFGCSRCLLINVKRACVGNDNFSESENRHQTFVIRLPSSLLHHTSSSYQRACSRDS